MIALYGRVTQDVPCVRRSGSGFERSHADLALPRGTQMKVANVHQNAAELIDVIRDRANKVST